MYPPKFGYVIPDNIKEALEFLESHEDAKVLAGGHSLIPMLKLRLLRPSYLVEIRRLSDLSYIKLDGDTYKIGALTTHYDISKAKIPLLSETASKIGDPQVRNMGTIGGSISHADPAADYPAALIALDAQVKIISTKGERVVPISSFIKDIFTTDLNPGEIVSEIQFKNLKDYKFSYQKLERRAGDFAIVGVAVALKMSGDVIDDIRIGLTAVGNGPIRPTKAEEAIKGKRPTDDVLDQVGEIAMSYANPKADIRGSAEYKKKMVKVLTKRAILTAIQR
ncbi:MAG: glyceraldehyde dehydrogenase subunit beta [Sulfolobaceae archaeon]|nr:glyceraldehyde dehydrogenase subunit beta [Sulfolobaceae archaeon]